jgi:GxxExxY protein
MSVFYDGINIGSRRADFFVEYKIMLELKAVPFLDDLHMAQAINYLEIFNLPSGLLINFGNKSLEFKRVYNSRHPDNKNYRKV